MTSAGSRFAHARKPPSLLFFHVHVLSVDHAFIFLLTATVTARARSSSVRRSSTTRFACFGSLRLRRLVHLFGQFMRSLSQVLASLIHLRLVVRFQRLLGVGHRVLHVATLRAG